MANDVQAVNLLSLPPGVSILTLLHVILPTFFRA